MRRLGRVGLIAISGLLLLGPGALGAPAAPADVYQDQVPDLVAGLVVQAATPGPAWWKVSKGEAVVWILGVPPYASPKGQWTRAPLRRRLAGAQAFITSPVIWPQPRQGRADVPGLDPLFDGLPPPRVREMSPALQTRLKSLIADWGVPDITDNSSVIFATRLVNLAMMLRSDLTISAMDDILAEEAKTARVNIIRLPGEFTKTANRLTDTYAYGEAQPKIDCLEKTLDVAETSANPLRPAYEAWEAGDIPNALATLGCVGVKGAVYRAEIADLMPILRRYLARPGKAVAAIELAPLLMEDGVIQQLKALGFTIVEPDALRETG